MRDGLDSAKRAMTWGQSRDTLHGAIMGNRNGWLDFQRAERHIGVMNAAWHAKHRMPRNATLAQRVRWHVAHEKHCGCRPMPRHVRHAIRSGRPGGSRRRDRAD